MTAVLEATVRVVAGELDVGLADLGPADGQPVLLLHGWPYDIQTYGEAAPMLADVGYRVLVPYLRGYGSTRFISESAPRNAQQTVFAVDAITLLDAMGIDRVLVAGVDWGARTANILAALWPARCSGLVAVSGYLIGSQAANASPLPPAAELSWWYQFYFATERGRLGYGQNRREFARLIWRTASPKWAFDDDTFERTVASFDNPDHVDVVIANYRWRLGLAPGEPVYDELESQLADRPVIGIPTVTLEGDANGAPHPDAAVYRDRFVGAYEHRTITGGIGHNLPQEAPRAFADAVIAVDRAAHGSAVLQEASRVR